MSIPYVLTWDGIITKFHKTYTKEIGLTTKIQSYIQFIVLLKGYPMTTGEKITPESIENVIEAGETGCTSLEIAVSVEKEKPEQ